MSERKCIKIEIAECQWSQDLKFIVRFGDLDGSTTSSNLDSLKEVLDSIKIEMILNWPELRGRKK